MGHLSMKHTNTEFPDPAQVHMMHPLEHKVAVAQIRLKIAQTHLEFHQLLETFDYTRYWLERLAGGPEPDFELALSSSELTTEERRHIARLSAQYRVLCDALFALHQTRLRP